MFNFCTADPDQILPAEKFSTYLRHEPVKLRLNGSEAEKPISVPTLLLNTVQRHGHGTALGECVSFPFWASILSIFNTAQFSLKTLFLHFT